MKPTLLVIGGPTASGKTKLAIKLAQKFDTSIVSADSRQFYKEMNIGTAKPTLEERQQAEHYLVDHLSIHDHYTVGDYEKEVLDLLAHLFEKKKKVILSGGSGLFIKAVCEGLDQFPDVAPTIREELNDAFKTKGIEFLQTELKNTDPEYYKIVDLQNPVRLIRALEVYRASGKPFSSFRNQKPKDRFFQSHCFYLNPERALLYEKINQRVDQMLSQGLEAEAKALYPYKHLNALQTVGYQEWFDHFDGSIDRNTAIELIKRNSRRYAKRQMTWLRNQQNWTIWEGENSLLPITD